MGNSITSPSNINSGATSVTTAQPIFVSGGIHRIIVFGASKVGKLALTKQFVETVSLDYDSTVENMFSKQFELFGNPVSVDIHLVTRLSEELQVTQDAIIRQGEGFILVYCVTDQESFSQCVNMQQQILRTKDADRIPIVLVGNKSDLTANRVVSTAQGEQLAKQNGWTYFETSAKNEKINVDEVFHEITRQIISSKNATQRPAAPK
jgi:small GTP-binding protein